VILLSPIFLQCCVGENTETETGEVLRFRLPRDLDLQSAAKFRSIRGKKLDAIVKDLRQERARLDIAIAALTSALGGSTPKTAHGADDVSHCTKADCCRTKSTMGKSQGPKGYSNRSQAAHLSGGSSADQSGSTCEMGEGESGKEVT